MSFAKSIETKINKIPDGVIFSADMLKIQKTSASRQTLSRLVRKEAIKRVAGGQGLYYKPKKGLLGEMKPTRGQVLDAIFKSEPNSYLTGVGLYNQLGLTTQVTGLITIASNGTPQTRTLSGKKIKFTRARAIIRKKDIPFLQLLDALTDIKKVPDALPDDTVLKLINKIQHLDQNGLKEMVKLCFEYPKRTIALLGAILENFEELDLARALRDQLNIGTEYKLNLTQKSLPNLNAWNIR